MPDPVGVELTGLCTTAPADDVLLLPKGSTLPTGRILVEGGNRTALMQAGLRADNGTAACVSGSTIGLFGGEGAAVTYRPVGFFETLSRDDGLLLKFVISLLTLLAALLNAYLTFVQSSHANADSITYLTSFAVLALAWALSALTFVKDYRDL